MSQLKIGLIGNGSISESHLLAYQSNPKAQIIAICDLNESRAQAGAKNSMPRMYIPIIAIFWLIQRLTQSVSALGTIHMLKSVSLPLRPVSMYCVRSHFAKPSMKHYKLKQRFVAPGSYSKWVTYVAMHLTFPY